MKYSESLNLIAEIASDQWGLITNQQAERFGISRLKLSRLAKDEVLTRIRSGVYLDSGAQLGDETYIRAQWLSFKPEALAHERLKHPEKDVVVAGQTACWLYGAGDFIPSPHLFYSSERHQKQTQGIRVLRRRLAPNQIRIVDGLPLTSPEQTIHDLLKQGVDLESVKSAVSDMSPLGLNLDKLLAPIREISQHTGIESSRLRDTLAQATFDFGEVSRQLQVAIRNNVDLKGSGGELSELMTSLVAAGIRSPTAN
jgi:hypothetical protein